jgi:hypothetical protein
MCVSNHFQSFKLWKRFIRIMSNEFTTAPARILSPHRFRANPSLNRAEAGQMTGFYHHFVVLA